LCGARPSPVQVVAENQQKRRIVFVDDRPNAAAAATATAAGVVVNGGVSGSEDGVAGAKHRMAEALAEEATGGGGDGKGVDEG